MAIDVERLREFQRQIADLAVRLSPESHFDIVKSKVIDYLEKHPGVDQRDMEYVLKQAFNPEFAQWLKKIFESYNTSLDLVNELYSDLGVDVQRDFSKIRRIEEINRTQLGNYSEDSYKALRKAVRISIVDNLSAKESGALISSTSDKAAAYGQVIANTQLKAYNRTAKREKANLAGVVWYKYMGLLRERSRTFCRETLNEYHHIDEINGFTAAEVGKAFITPCIIYCGGWNCRHDWEPDPFYKP
jgi:hypothetical protein